MHVPELPCAQNRLRRALEPLKFLAESTRPLTTTCSRRVLGECRHVQGIERIDQYRSSQFAIRSTVLATFRLAPQARHELARTCTGHDLLSLLLPTTMPHMLGVQDENSRVECDEMAE